MPGRGGARRGIAAFLIDKRFAGFSVGVLIGGLDEERAVLAGIQLGIMQACLVPTSAGGDCPASSWAVSS
jgi:hypothetical protein